MEMDLGFALKNSLPEKMFTIFENIERYTLPDSGVNPAVVISMDQFFESCFEILKSNLSKSKGDYREKYANLYTKKCMERKLKLWLSMQELNVDYLMKN